MKLLMITGLGSGTDLASGKKGAFYNTLEEFHKYWDRIDIIVPKTINYDRRIEVEPHFGNVYLHISSWPLIFHPIFFIKKGIELYRQQRFDLMTVQEFPPFYNGIGARLLWNKIKVPYILEIMHIPGYPKAANLKERLYRLASELFLKTDSAKAVAVRVINKKEAPEFLIKAGIPAKKIVYIPANYIDLEIFKPMSVPKKYDLIFSGRLAENKGINLLLEAASRLKIKNEKLKIMIVGDGPLQKSLKFKVKSLKLENNVVFHGWAKDSEEVARLINESRVLIMPSFNEGGPRVVAEAMACGVPVLATPVGIVPDLLKNGPGGEIIDWSVNDIIAKTEALLGDIEAYRKHSSAGPELAKQFEKKAAIKNYADKLKALI